MHESVEDGISECGLTDDVVPLFDRQLRGDEGGTGRMSVIEDVEQVATLLGIQWCQAPQSFFEDDEIGFGELYEEPGDRSRRRGR